MQPQIIITDDEPGYCLLTQIAEAESAYSHVPGCARDGEGILDSLHHQGKHPHSYEFPLPSMILPGLNINKTNWPPSHTGDSLTSRHSATCKWLFSRIPLLKRKHTY